MSVTWTYRWRPRLEHQARREPRPPGRRDPASGRASCLHRDRGGPLVGQRRATRRSLPFRWQVPGDAQPGLRQPSSIHSVAVFRHRGPPLARRPRRWRPVSGSPHAGRRACDEIRSTASCGSYSEDTSGNTRKRRTDDSGSLRRSGRRQVAPGMTSVLTPPRQCQWHLPVEARSRPPWCAADLGDLIVDREFASKRAPARRGAPPALRSSRARRGRRLLSGDSSRRRRGRAWPAWTTRPATASGRFP